MSGGLSQLVDLVDGDLGSGENSDQDGFPQAGYHIPVSAANFVNQPVSPQQTKSTADSSRASFTLHRRSGLGSEEEFLNVTVTEAIDKKFAVIDGGEQELIVSPGTQP